VLVREAKQGTATIGCGGERRPAHGPSSDGSRGQLRHRRHAPGEARGECASIGSVGMSAPRRPRPDVLRCMMLKVMSQRQNAKLNAGGRRGRAAARPRRRAPRRYDDDADESKRRRARLCGRVRRRRSMRARRRWPSIMSHRTATSSVGEQARVGEGAPPGSRASETDRGPDDLPGPYVSRESRGASPASTATSGSAPRGRRESDATLPSQIAACKCAQDVASYPTYPHRSWHGDGGFVLTTAWPRPFRAGDHRHGGSNTGAPASWRRLRVVGDAGGGARSGRQRCARADRRGMTREHDDYLTLRERGGAAATLPSRCFNQPAHNASGIARGAAWIPGCWRRCAEVEARARRAACATVDGDLTRAEVLDASRRSAELGRDVAYTEWWRRRRVDAGVRQYGYDVARGRAARRCSWRWASSTSIRSEGATLLEVASAARSVGGAGFRGYARFAVRPNKSVYCARP